MLITERLYVCHQSVVKDFAPLFSAVRTASYTVIVKRIQVTSKHNRHYIKM